MPREQKTFQLARRSPLMRRHIAEGIIIAAVTFLGFAGFFRFNELVSIQPNHIFSHEEFVKVFEAMSKTEVYREGTMCISLS